MEFFLYLFAFANVPVKVQFKAEKVRQEINRSKKVWRFIFIWFSRSHLSPFVCVHLTLLMLIILIEVKKKAVISAFAWVFLVICINVDCRAVARTYARCFSSKESLMKSLRWKVICNRRRKSFHVIVKHVNRKTFLKIYAKGGIWKSHEPENGHEISFVMCLSFFMTSS